MRRPKECHRVCTEEIEKSRLERKIVTIPIVEFLLSVGSRRTGRNGKHEEKKPTKKRFEECILLSSLYSGRGG